MSPEAVSRAGPVYLAMTCNDVIAVRFDPVPSRSPMRFFIARCASGVLLSSLATGVGQPLSRAASVMVSPAFARIRNPSGVKLRVPSASFAIAVGHPVSCACRGSWSRRVRSVPSGFVAVVAIPAESFQSLAEAVDQPVKVGCSEEGPLADVRCADARCRNNPRPCGVTCRLETIE